MRGLLIDGLLFATDRLRIVVLTVALLGMAHTALAVWASGQAETHAPRSEARIVRSPERS